MIRYSSVIWDWNGTLLDDVDLCLEIANELLSEHRLPSLTHVRYREIFDFPVHLYWERAGFNLRRFDFEKISAAFCARFQERLHRAPLFPRAAQLLRSVQASGVRQFLLSATEDGALNRMVQRYGLDGVFAAVQGQPHGLALGKLATARSLLANHDVAPRSTVLIGDTVHDAEVALALGLDCILVEGGHHSNARLGATMIPVVESLDALESKLGLHSSGDAWPNPLIQATGSVRA